MQDILSAVSDPPSEPIPEQTAGPRQEPEEEKDGEPHQEQTEDSSHVNG